MLEDPQPGSPEHWRDRLLARLAERRREVDEMLVYYEHGGPMPSLPHSATDRSRAEYRYLTRLGVANWTGVVADAPASRLAITGFRFGESINGDQDAWKIWQRNALDADSGLVHAAGLQTGSACALVWGDEDGKAEITVEDPSQMIVAYRGGSRRRRAAALKHWVGDDGRWMATLYLPDGIYKWRSKNPQKSSGTRSPTSAPGGWEERQDDGDRKWPVDNPLRKVPVVEFRANPTLRPQPYGGGRAEFARVLSDQDRINHTLFDRLCTAHWLGFPQRYIKGWDAPETESGEPDREKALEFVRKSFWALNEEAEPGQFPAADFLTFIKAFESDVASMLATTSTPPYYSPFGQLVNISADSLKAIEAGFIAKCESHALNFGESWEEVMRLALQVEEDPRADDMSSQVIWRDIENRTWGQTVDAVTKMLALGVPAEALWSKLPGVTDQDINRWKAMNATTALLGDLAALPTAPEPTLAEVTAPVPAVTVDGLDA